MGNIILGFPNRIDSAVLSGGAWVETLPLDNLKNRQLARVARSVDLDAASATFVIDLQQAQTLRIIAFVAHNFSLSGRIHLEFSTEADFSEIALDTWMDAWPSVSDGPWDENDLEWENDNFWTGTYLQEDVEGLTPVASLLLPSDVSVRYIRVTIEDEGNPAGYVQIGRLFLGTAFLQPAINYKFGATIGYEDATTVDTALSGAEFFDQREPIRVMKFTLGYLSDEEGYGRALELTRRAGISREIFLIADPDDVTYSATRNFLGRLRQLSPLESLAMWASSGLQHSMAFELKEIR